MESARSQGAKRRRIARVILNHFNYLECDLPTTRALAVSKVVADRRTSLNRPQSTSAVSSCYDDNLDDSYDPISPSWATTTMEHSPRFPVGTFDNIPPVARSSSSNNQVAHIANNSFQQPNSRDRSRDSTPRSPFVVDSTYSRRSSLPTFSSDSSEGNSYFAQHAIAYNSIDGPLTGSSGFSFTPSLLWRSDSIVSRNTFRTIKSSTSSTSNASSAWSKHSSMWGTSDTDGSRRSGLRSFLSLGSAPRTASDASDGQDGPVSSPGHNAGMITFAQAGEAFNNSNQRGRAMSVDNTSSVVWNSSLSPYAVPPLRTRLPSDTRDSTDTSFTSRDYRITTDVHTLEDIPEASTGLLYESERFNDNSFVEETPLYRGLTSPPKLSNSSLTQPSAPPTDSPAKTLKPISPIPPSPATTRQLTRSTSVATYTTTATVRSTIKRARRGEALARLEGKFYETPLMEDKIESFMGFDDDDDSEDGDKTDGGGSGHLDTLSVGLDLQSLPLPNKSESLLVAPHSTGLASTSSSPHARPLEIASSPGSGAHDSPPPPQATLPTQPPNPRTQERTKDIRVQIKSAKLADLSSQLSPGTPLLSSSGTPPPTSATTSSSRNASPSSLSSFTPTFDEPPRSRPGRRDNRDRAKKDKGFPDAVGSLESLFSIGIRTGDGESPRLNRFEFETWLELDGDDSGADGRSKKNLL